MAQAKELIPQGSSAEILSSVSSLKPGQSFWVTIRIPLQLGWHTYWKNPGESGFPAQIQWTLPEGFSASPIHWPPPQRIMHKDKIIFGYDKDCYLLVQITPPSSLSNIPIQLKGTVNWLACETTCVPESSDFSLTLNVSSKNETFSPHKNLIDILVDNLPVKLPLTAQYFLAEDAFVLTFPEGLYTSPSPKEVSFLPHEPKLTKLTTDQSWDIEDNKIVLTLKTPSEMNFEMKQEKLEGLVRIEYKDASGTKDLYINVSFDPSKTIPNGKKRLSHPNILMVILFALLGGCILNAMPCVFPVLSLKAVSIAKDATLHPQVVRQQGFFFTAGVLLTFIILASLLVFARSFGQSVGWGFQMQNPHFIALLIYLLFFIGFSLSGFFYLPILFGSLTPAPSSHRGWSHFWVGALAVLIATPCTAPLMGVAVGYALTQSIPIILITFIALGIGFALPYLLLCLFPKARSLLPKPGAWMENFKEFMAFPMYASGAWFLWVLTQQTGTRGLSLSLMGLLLMAFSIWFWAKIKLWEKFSNPLLRTIGVILLSLITIAPVAYLNDQTKIEQTIPTEPFSISKLKQYQQENKPVFVYATAAWCITCKINEWVFKSNSVQTLFKELGVIVMEADWTNHSHEIGEFLKEHKHSGVPLYVYYPERDNTSLDHPEGIILPQILMETNLIETVTKASKGQG